MRPAVMQAMRPLGDRNDWWDWGIILLVVAGGTIMLWASIWLVHSRFAASGGATISAIGDATGGRAASPGRLMHWFLHPHLHAPYRTFDPLAGAPRTSAVSRGS